MFGNSGINPGYSGITQNVSNFNSTVNNYFGNQINNFSQGLSGCSGNLLGNQIGGCSYQNYGYGGGYGSQSYNLGNSLGNFMGCSSQQPQALTWANMLSNYQIPNYTSTYTPITRMPNDGLYNNAMNMSGIGTNYNGGYSYTNNGQVNYGYGSGYGSNYGGGYNSGNYGNYSRYTYGNLGAGISNSQPVTWSNMLSNYQIPNYTSTYSTISQMPADNLYNNAMNMSGMTSSIGWANFLGGWRG